MGRAYWSMSWAGLDGIFGCVFGVMICCSGGGLVGMECDEGSGSYTSLHKVLTTD